MHNFRNGLCSALPHRQIARSVHDVVFLASLAVAYLPYQTNLCRNHAVVFGGIDGVDAVEVLIVNPDHTSLQLYVEVVIYPVTYGKVASQSEINLVVEFVGKLFVVLDSRRELLQVDTRCQHHSPAAVTVAAAEEVQQVYLCVQSEIP